MKLSFGSTIFSALFLLGKMTLVSSVLYGDEQYGDIDGGRFWAFHSSGVSIVNAETCEIEKEIEKDQNGDNLPNAWYDGVYMEPTGSVDRARYLAHSKERSHGYILINSGISISDGHENPGGGTGEVVVMSASPADYEDPVVARVKVGSRPVHSYSVYKRDEFWTHSDGDGYFYVINLDDVTKHTGKPILAKSEEANHGKLLWDESGHLTKHGFATSTGERIVFIIDMVTHDQVGMYNYTDDLTLENPRYCMGTHAIAYSSTNNHVYLECVAGGGTLELDVNDPENPLFVAQHKEASGSLYETPDASLVVASDKTGNKLHVFKPAGKGQTSSIEFVVDVPGHPSTPTFYPMGTSNPSYVACMPLTENTNLNHRNEEGEITCDYYGCSGASSPEDVANGVCLYDVSGRNLQEATLEQIDSVKSEVAPFNSACSRCKVEGNYDESGKCICTPYCGSCAEPNYDASLSGVRCLNLEDLISNGSAETTLIEGAGAVKQGSPYAYSPQCGFGRTYRTHKRGGKYDASIAHFPLDSLQIVNMETQELKCQVKLSGKPDRVVYVPIQPGQQHAAYKKEEEAILGTWAAIGIAAGSLVVVASIVYLACGKKPEQADANTMETKHDMENVPSGAENVIS